jgi:hypothetical protein
VPIWLTQRQYERKYSSAFDGAVAGMQSAAQSDYNSLGSARRPHGTVPPRSIPSPNRRAGIVDRAGMIEIDSQSCFRHSKELKEPTKMHSAESTAHKEALRRDGAINFLC